jgi:hypothetical protein
MQGACRRPLRLDLRGEFSDLGADRIERAELVLRKAEVVCIGAVRDVHWLLQPVREFPLEIGSLRPLGAVDEASNIVGVLVAQKRGCLGRAERHVLFGKSSGRQNARHAGPLL